MQSAATQSKDVTKAIGTSIAVVNPSRGGKAANGLQLQKPTSSGKIKIYDLTRLTLLVSFDSTRTP